MIKSVINKQKVNTPSDKFQINNQIITDRNIIANTFNNFYVNIGPNLAKNICSFVNPTSYMSVQNPNSMFMTPVLPKEVENIIKLLKKSSPGWDNITADIIKDTHDLFVIAFTHILNLSITQGVFP